MVSHPHPCLGPLLLQKVSSSDTTLGEKREKRSETSLDILARIGVHNTRVVIFVEWDLRTISSNPMQFHYLHSHGSILLGPSDKVPISPVPSEHIYGKNGLVLVRRVVVVVVAIDIDVDENPITPHLDSEKQDTVVLFPVEKNFTDNSVSGGPAVLRSF